MTEEQTLLTARESSKILRIHLRTFYRRVKEGKIPAFKLGGKTSPWKVRREDINTLTEQGMDKGRPQDEDVG